MKVIIEVNGTLYYTIPIGVLAEGYGEFQSIVVYRTKRGVWMSWYAFNEDNLEALLQAYCSNSQREK